MSKPRVCIALVHHPCVDRAGEIYATSITNLDIHDVARSSRTYDVDAFYVVHAIEAQRGRGHVRLDIHDEPDAVVFRVSDAGPGIRGDARRRVFDPFFTTRAEGTGLGLAVVQRVAELHGGSLELDPHPGELGGATFTLRIPRSLDSDSPEGQNR